MEDTKHMLADVYGVSRELPLNYVARKHIDGAFIDNLRRDKHIVIYGSSKQGKTSLRKHNLLEEDYIVVTCSNRWSLTDLHTAILKRAGFVVEQSSSVTVQGNHKVAAKFGASVGVPGTAKLTFEAGGDAGAIEENQTNYVNLELDASDVNDVISALEDISFNRFIVLEDFHYLSEDTQQDFAVALKAFHEDSKFSFIVVGVWLDENRLIQLNGDLTGRVIAISVDSWNEAELLEVVAAGEALLNITFDEEFKSTLVRSALESVHIVQEACYLACEREGILTTQDSPVVVGANADAADLVKAVVDAQSARYHQFVTRFAGGFQDTRLEMYRWLLYPVLTSDIPTLESGLSYSSIRKTIMTGHPEGSKLNPGNVTQALRAASSLQVHLNIKPIVLDYDQSALRLRVVDRGFLIWLENQDRKELLETVDLPTASIRSADG